MVGEEGELPTVDEDLGASREGSRTDDETVERSDILNLSLATSYQSYKIFILLSNIVCIETVERSYNLNLFLATFYQETFFQKMF